MTREASRRFSDASSLFLGWTETLETRALARRALALVSVAVTLASVGVGTGALAAGTTTSTHSATKPPYYHGKTPTRDGASGRLPVVVARSTPGVPEPWLPREALGRLAADVDGWLARLDGVRPIAPVPETPRTPRPSVYLGCAPDDSIGGDCIEEPRGNVLAITSGSREWREAVARAAAEAGVDRVLVLQVEVAAHWIHQRNLRGAKEVRLGTNRVQALPWLTSLDTPVYVLQLTGLVVDSEGRVQRGGAEGLWAIRTPFRASMLRPQRLLEDDEVEIARTALRDGDRPDSPLVWEAAAQQLVEQLLGGEAVAGSGDA